LTNWAEQTLKRRLENVRGVGSVTVVGGTKREINIYLNPQALEAFGITPDQVVTAVRNENLDVPVGTIRSMEQERVIQIEARMQRPEDFGRIIVARKNGARCVWSNWRVWQMAHRKWTAWPSITGNARFC
jgi:HAE1 family hydrophobic/amphiphilic exporter-1